MMVQEQAQEGSFQLNLEKLYLLATQEEDALNKIRSKAWDHFLEIGLPTKKTEPYKYVRLRQLFPQIYSEAKLSSISKDQIEELVYPECKQSFIVFINGYYCEKDSCLVGISNKVVITDLSRASRTYGAFLNNHWAKAMQGEVDAFAALNAATHKKGLFIYVPPGVTIENPIQIIQIIDPGINNPIIVPRIQVFAGKSAEFQIISSLSIHSEGSYGINQVVDFSLDENSRVKFTHTVLNQNESIWHFDAVRATLKRNSHFQSINVTDGSYRYRNDYHIILAQEGCEAELDGITMLSKSKEVHTHVFMDHQAPNCRSRQLFKSVLKDSSRGSFEGKIFVRQAAQKTDAFQLNNNLLLSEKAHADSKPNLEIFADDVKASHGATVGRLNQEQIFYLKSRGFSEMDAQSLLIAGYCKDIIDRVTIPSLLEILKDKLENYIR